MAAKAKSKPAKRTKTTKRSASAKSAKPTAKASPKKEKKDKKEKKEIIQAARGTQDILPAEQKYWEYVVETGKSVIRGFGFQRLDTPLYEELQLFERGIGEETDVVSKEMFELKSRGGSPRYALRPEGTASVARAYIEHGMRSWPKPVKLFYTGPMFRYERPQAERFRQHHQLGAEVFGSSAPVTDALLMYMTHAYFQELGIEDYTLRVNSLGVAGERKSYLKLLKDHYRQNRSKLCKTCKERLKTNPLRVLDCKEEKCEQVANTAPRLIDHLRESSREHFDAVLATLDELEVPYEVSPSLVRGLDYYVHTVFEFTAHQREDVAQNALAGGGRYDGLIKQLGGRDVPGIGLSIGVERVIAQLKAEGIELSSPDAPQIFVAHLGNEAKIVAIKLFRELQRAGIPFAESLDRDGMQPQLSVADRLGVDWALIIGHKEVIDNSVILRNMDSGMQEVVKQADLVSELKSRLIESVTESEED